MISSQRQFRRPSVRRPRRAAVLIILIAVFAVVMALAAVWAKRMVIEHRRQRGLERQAQAEWLAEAGLRRAAARLALSAEYQGETWAIAASELNQRADAEVLINVEPIAGSPTKYRLVARARYPAREPRVQTTKSLEFSPPRSEPAS